MVRLFSLGFSLLGLFLSLVRLIEKFEGGIKMFDVGGLLFCGLNFEKYKIRLFVSYFIDMLLLVVGCYVC